MVRKTAFLALLLLVGAAFFSSCKKEELSSKKEILSFFFEASKNTQLDRVFLGDVNGTALSAEVAFGVDVSVLVPTIEISPRATISPLPGQITNFTGPVVYTVTAEDGSTKTFTANVAIAAAPYIGKWVSGPIDYGSGLMRVNAEINKDGEISIVFTLIMTGDKDPSSMKGYFEPISRQNTEIKVVQTHRWFNSDWISETCDRTIMYQVITPQNIKLYYCLCHPKTDWCFQVNMTKE